MLCLRFSHEVDLHDLEGGRGPKPFLFRSGGRYGFVQWPCSAFPCPVSRLLHEQGQLHGWHSFLLLPDLGLQLLWWLMSASDFCSCSHSHGLVNTCPHVERQE